MGDKLKDTLITVTLNYCNGKQFLIKKRNHLPLFFSINNSFIFTLLNKLLHYVNK